jgi:hypothetical protein
MELRSKRRCRPRSHKTGKLNSFNGTIRTCVDSNEKAWNLRLLHVRYTTLFRFPDKFYPRKYYKKVKKDLSYHDTQGILRGIISMYKFLSINMLNVVYYGMSSMKINDH